jgi:hypothetical protein
VSPLVFFQVSLIHLSVQGTWQFISVRLLSEPGVEHLLQDDLESFFWVLLWVSLRYTRHNQPPEELADLLSAFDQVYEDSNRGGQHKLAMLVMRRASQITFAASDHLNLVLQALSDLFNTRYRPEPTPFEMGLYEQLISLVGADHGLVKSHAVYLYHEQKERLQSSTFILNLLKQETSDRSLWPRNDKNTIQLFYKQPLTAKKRQSDIAKLESACHSQPKKFKSRSDSEESQEDISMAWSSGDEVHSSEGEDVFL